MSRVRRMRRMKEKEKTVALLDLKEITHKYIDELEYYHIQGVKKVRFVFDNWNDAWKKQVNYINHKNILTDVNKNGFEKWVWNLVKTGRKKKLDETSKLLVKMVKRSTGRKWLFKMWLNDLRRK